MVIWLVKQYFVKVLAVILLLISYIYDSTTFPWPFMFYVCFLVAFCLNFQAGPEIISTSAIVNELPFLWLTECKEKKSLKVTDHDKVFKLTF